MRPTGRREPGFGAFDHEVADHLAGDAHGGSDSAYDLAVVAVESQGDPDHVAVPVIECEAALLAAKQAEIAFKTATSAMFDINNRGAPTGIAVDNMPRGILPEQDERTFWSR